VSVMGLRMPIAVACGGKRLDAEIEVVDIESAGHVRDRLVSEPVEKCEKRIEGDEYQRGGRR
jgi:hypothetical protein